MLRSPLHLLISLHRYLLRTKTRHRSIHLLFRPITKTTPWSAGVSKISNTYSPVFTKYIPSLGQREQTSQLLRIIQQHSTSTSTTSTTTRRLFIHRRSQGNGSVCIQRRTIVSSGSSNGGSQLTTVLNGNHLFTPRSPILGVQLLPPPPPTSFRSYTSTKSPWNLRQQQQHHFTIPYSSINNDNDSDDNYFDNNTRFYRINQQHHLTNPSSSTTTTTTTTTSSTDHDGNRRIGKKQHSYRPPDIRGIADLMENNEDDDGNNTRNRNHSHISVVHSGGYGNNVYHPGLVRRGQPPRRPSPQQTQQANCTTNTPTKSFPSPVDVLRHDDLSLQTTKKRLSYDATSPPSAIITTNDKCSEQQQQWYISIPMDLTPYSHDSNTTPSSSSALQNLMFMENTVSILDPTWLASFDSWGKLVQEHLAKVTILIQSMGMEAQRYSAKRHLNIDKQATTTTTTIDFKMMMKKSDICAELHIYLPDQLLAPLPTTRSSIQHWVDQLMKDPPNYEIKCHTSTNTMDALTTMKDDDNDDNTHTSATRCSLSVDRMDTTPVDNDGDDDDDDDLVMIPSTLVGTDQGLANNNNNDDSALHIDPHYFQGIHTFLNHVDSMIDSSPAFATSGSQRRL